MSTTNLNANILIVDDQEANIDILEGFLTMQGYKSIKSLQDPREVLPCIPTFNPDIILLDLSMPYITGFEILELLKPIISPNNFLPILVLTADVTKESKQKALASGAIDFLTKPFDLIEVGLRIKNLLYTRYLYKQLQNQNQILEEKVKDRTFELEKANTELTIAKDKAEASDRLKTAFMQNISHEIRTPLNAIIGFSSILVDNSLPEEERENIARMLEASGNRLITTITNYLDISLIVSGNISPKIESTNVINVLDEVIELYKNDCSEKNIKTHALFANNNLVIETDTKFLYKIFSQLIDNAIKFTNDGSIFIKAFIYDSSVKIEIIDTGVGIAEEVQNKIFEGFTQESTDITRGYEGSGVGLTIAKGLVTMLKGKIYLVSEKGKGSTFTVELPLEYS